MDGEPPSLEPGAVTKIHALNFPRDEKTPNDLVQVEPASVRLGHGGLCVLGRLASNAARRARVNSCACKCVSARVMAAWAA